MYDYLYCSRKSEVLVRISERRGLRLMNGWLPAGTALQLAVQRCWVTVMQCTAAGFVCGGPYTQCIRTVDF